MIEGSEAVQLRVGEEAVLKIGIWEGTVNAATVVGRASDADDGEDLLAAPSLELGVQLVTVHPSRSLLGELLAPVGSGHVVLSGY